MNYNATEMIQIMINHNSFEMPLFLWLLYFTFLLFKLIQPYGLKSLFLKKKAKPKKKKKKSKNIWLFGFGLERIV